MNDAASPQIPATVIGGYLGAGKTTLVNHLLRHADGKRLAVLVNEFGELPIDADLIESQDDNIINIAGGCVCCSYGSDLMAALLDLLDMDTAPDHLLIEASGVALPGAIAQSVNLVVRYFVDGIVVLADAETLLNHADDPYLSDTIERQFEDADIIVLNKADLASPVTAAKTRAWLSAMFPSARAINAKNAVLPPALVLGLGMDHQMAAAKSKGHGQHRDLHGATVLEIKRAVDPEKIAKFLASPETNIVRSKGFIKSLPDSTVCIQTVGRRWDIKAVPDHHGEVGRIVCISVGDVEDLNSLSDRITEFD